jgi:hypothetical protein
MGLAGRLGGPLSLTLKQNTLEEGVQFKIEITSYLKYLRLTLQGQN